MAKVSFTFSKRTNLLKQVAKNLPVAVDALMVEAAEEVGLPIAQQLCPVDTGRLQESIRVERPRRLLVKLLAGGVTIDGVLVDYAPYVEPDQPFLEPAWQYAMQHFEHLMKQKLKSKVLTGS
jgi:hypothetical protein